MNVLSLTHNFIRNAIDCLSSGGKPNDARSVATVGPGNLQEASAERPLRTREIHAQNDFYGNAAILKGYAGIPITHSLKAAIEHGVFLGGFCWDVDINSCLPAMLVPAPFRFPILKKHTHKSLYAIGGMIGYAPQLLAAADLQAEKKRLGKNLLAFPAHSTHHVESRFDVDQYCKSLERLGGAFNSVRVCLYWKDVLRGLGTEFSRRGFECVTAGHIFDPLFLPRLKSIMECATITTSNQLGTQLGYSVLLGKPHFLTAVKIELKAESDEILKRDAAERSGQRDVEEIVEVFSELRDDISESQREIVDRYWGTSHKKSPAQLKAILQQTEEDYRKTRNVPMRLKDKYRWLFRR